MLTPSSQRTRVQDPDLPKPGVINRCRGCLLHHNREQIRVRSLAHPVSCGSPELGGLSHGGSSLWPHKQRGRCLRDACNSILTWQPWFCELQKVASRMLQEVAFIPGQCG